jgi:hypothetical protein
MMSTKGLITGGVSQRVFINALRFDTIRAEYIRAARDA